MFNSLQAIKPSSCSDEVEITLPHIRLGGRLWGNDDKPLIVALHGWLDNANSFQPLSEHLKEYQLLAIDWPGHGNSQHRPGSYPLHWIDYLYDLEVLIEYLNGIKPVYAVIGHSLGGIVTSAYSAAFADKVPNWILIEAPSPLFEDAIKSRQRLIASFREHLRLSQSKAKPVSFEAAVKARSQLTGLDKQWCRLIIERNLKSVEGKNYWCSDPRLKLNSPMRLNIEQVKGLMQAHNGKVLLISAEQGYRELSPTFELALNWYRDLTHISLTGDHHLHMGNSEAVAIAIKEFLVKPGN